MRSLLVGYYLLYVAWFVLGGATGSTRTFITDAAYLPVGAAGLVLAARAGWRAPHRRDHLVWGLIAFALACRLQGDASWWWLEAVDHRSPFPSVADIGYNGFYPVLILAVALTPVRRQSRLASAASTLDVLAMVGAVFMVIWYLVLGAAVQVGAHDPSRRCWTSAIRCGISCSCWRQGGWCCEAATRGGPRQPGG